MAGVSLAGVSLAGVLCGGVPAAAGEWHGTPSLEVAETYTDNVDLDSVEREYDFITRITPGIHITGQGGRLDLDLDYKANFLIFARNEEDTDLRHQLSSSLDSELVEDWLFLDARASITQQFLERGGTISRNDANISDNRRTVQNYSISPSVKRQLGTFATAVARYRVGYVRVGDPENPEVIPTAQLLDNTLTHQTSFELDSGRRFTRFTWGVRADYAYYQRSGGRRDSDRVTLLTDGGYRVNQWLRLEGSLGYEEISDRSLFSRPSGVVWNAGFTLTPGPRTTLSVRGGRRYEREHWNIEGLYRFSERTVFNLSYREEITNSFSILQEDLLDDPADPDFPGLEPGGGSLIDVAFYRRILSATLSGTRGLNSFGLTGFYEERRPQTTLPAEDNYGGNLYLSRQLSRYASVSVGGTYQHTKFEGNLQRSDDFYSAQAGLNYLFSEYLSGGVTYFYTNRESTFGLGDLRENAVRVNLRATF